MKLGDRIDTLSETLQHTSEWATKLEKDGISLRFLNDVQDDTDKFSGLTDPAQLDDVLTNISFRGGTKLGTVLRKKVVQPLAEKAMKTDGRVKPRIIMIITDGKVRFPNTYIAAHLMTGNSQPQGEYENCLRDVILHSKTGEGLGSRFGQAATVFLLTIVGNDDEAREFVSKLKRDKDLKNMVYTLTDPLNKVMDLLSQEPDDVGYKVYVSDLMKSLVTFGSF